MIDQYTWLKSEKAELMRFLQDLPEDDIFIRPGFEHRLKKVDVELDKMEENGDEPILPLDCARCLGEARGAKCLRSATCKRYIAGKQLLPEPLKRAAAWMQPRTVGDECEYHWPIWD